MTARERTFRESRAVVARSAEGMRKVTHCVASPACRGTPQQAASPACQRRAGTRTADPCRPLRLRLRISTCERRHRRRRRCALIACVLLSEVRHRRRRRSETRQAAVLAAKFRNARASHLFLCTLSSYLTYLLRHLPHLYSSTITPTNIIIRQYTLT